MIDPENMMDGMMSEPDFEHFRTLDPDNEDVIEEAEQMGFRDGKRGPTVDGSGQGLNSDEL